MADLKNLKPKVFRMQADFVARCKTAGIDVIITQGFRTKEYQDSLYAQGRTKPGKIVTNCKGGFSPHNWSVAVDYAIMENGRVNWDSRNKKWSLAGVIGEKCGFNWGGRWTKFVDLPHLEYLAGYTYDQIRTGKFDEKKFA